MKQFLEKTSWQFYHAVHTNGLLADLVYSAAFYLNRVRRHFQYRSSNQVTVEELWRHRELQASGVLSTGVTNICNAKCSFCAYPKVVANKTLQTGVMSLEVFQRAVDEWAALGGQSIDLTPVVGDPLVDPGLLDKLDYAVKVARIKRVCLTTNAILLDKNDNYRQLIDRGVAEVYISTQGASKEMYEQVYGVKQYDEVMSGVRNLMEYNRSKGEPARIAVRFRNAEKPSQIIRSPDFQTQIKPFLSQRVRVNFTVDFDNWGGTILPSDMKGSMKMRQLPARLDLPCQALFTFAVRHDGSVRLCGCRLTKNDFDDLVVGNIKDNSLQDIAKSERAWKIIKGFYAGQRPETCLGCTLYQPINRRWLQQRALSKDAAPAPK